MLEADDEVDIQTRILRRQIARAMKRHGFEAVNAEPPEAFDPVNRPEHYNSHPSGIQCVEITEHMTCMIGCAIKYLWRHGQKAGTDADEDLRKAIWCIERERLRLAKLKEPNGK